MGSFIENQLGSQAVSSIKHNDLGGAIGALIRLLEIRLDKAREEQAKGDAARAELDRLKVLVFGCQSNIFGDDALYEGIRVRLGDLDRHHDYHVYDSAIGCVQEHGSLVWLYCRCGARMVVFGQVEQ
jgi:hypothetical protein